jgi:hypothetical protein
MVGERVKRESAFYIKVCLWGSAKDNEIMGGSCNEREESRCRRVARGKEMHGAIVQGSDS